ncbi:MAG: hypothetical protein CSA81_13305 [Acidobacteria bacterium]|nr:MAG: hypothetical protein CSA81_13305 [Acidobacteriota bacterium]
MKYNTKKILLALALLLAVMAVAQDGRIYSNDWDKVKLKGLNLIRLEVPGGWLVREGLGKMAFVGSATRMMIFVPDPEHEWRDIQVKDWQLLKLKGLNLYRLPVPQGWLIREGWGKLEFSESEIHMINFLYDPDHDWIVQPK